MDENSGVSDLLRVPEADVQSAVAFPFVGERGKLFLAMFMFDSKPIPTGVESVISLAMGRIAYAFYSRESAALPRTSPERALAGLFDDLLTPKELGWDTLDHSQRVRNVCDMLAEELPFSKTERFCISLVASCHDVGKKDLTKDVRKVMALLEAQLARDSSTSATGLTVMPDNEELTYRRHPQIGTSIFFEKLSKLANPPDSLTYWMLPILCHHANDGKIGQEPLTDTGMRNVCAALGIEQTTADAVLASVRSRAADYAGVLLATDCLRVSDWIEDKVGWKHHRPLSNQNITQALIEFNTSAAPHVEREVKDAVNASRERIKAFYEGLGRVEA